MKIYLNLSCFFILIVFPNLIRAQIISKEPKDLFITGNESVTYTSKINNKDYKLYVQLPESYNINLKQKYPVFYTLDAQETFGMVASIYNGIRFDGYVPEILIIGISYSGNKTNFDSLRTSDFTPTKLDDISKSGDASKFIRVLNDELIPMVDSLYRTDKINRTLAGASYAGLFTHYALFTNPSLFNGYLIINPSYDWDGNYAYNLESSFAINNSSINARVMLTSGQYDNTSAVTKMISQIKNHHYDDLKLNSCILDKMGHAGSKAESFARGFNFIFRRPIIIPSETELKKYTGIYKTPWGENVKIVIKEGELMMTSRNNPDGTKIFALKNSEFAYNGKHFDFHFNKDKSGNINSFSFQYNPYSSFNALKIK